MSKLEEKKVSSEILYKGAILNLKKDVVLLPDGKNANREIIEHRGGSSVVCVLNGKILLVKQYRYAVGEEIYEIPAGKLEKGEDPLNTARRELEEEGGVVAEKLTLLHEIYPTPAYSEEHIYIYLASGIIKEGKMHLDETEFLDAIWIDFQKAYDMVLSGKIKDAKTVVGILKYKSLMG